jgi:phosphoglucomutase
MKVSPCAGKPAEASMLVNVPKLITAYYTDVPDPSVQEQRVMFGTSGHRGSAESAVTDWIEVKANEFLEKGLLSLKRISFEEALRAPTTHRHDYLNAYISDLGNMIDMDAIRGAKISLGVDPLGGAGKWLEERT